MKTDGKLANPGPLGKQLLQEKWWFFDPYKYVIITSPPVVVRRIAMNCLYVCLSTHIWYLEKTCPNFTTFSVRYVAMARFCSDAVLPLFAHYGLYGSWLRVHIVKVIYHGWHRGEVVMSAMALFFCLRTDMLTISTEGCYRDVYLATIASSKLRVCCCCRDVCSEL